MNDNEIYHKKVEPVFTDARGSIFDLVEEKIGHVGRITFTPGAVRANHYHKQSVQYSYILSGEIEITTANIDGSNKKTQKVTAGMLSRIPAMMYHSYKAITDADMLDMTTLSRGEEGYEADTVRMTLP